MKISYDYDNTLTEYKVQLLAKERIQKGDEVYIISARSRPGPLFKLGAELGIKRSNIFAVGSNLNKIKKVEELGIDLHFDDNPKVIELLGKVGRLV